MLITKHVSGMAAFAAFLALAGIPVSAIAQNEDRSAYAVGDRSGYPSTLTDDERRTAQLLGVAVEDDGDLRKDRAVCDKGEMLAFGQSLEAEGTPFPAPHLFCREVLKEEGKRGRIGTYRHAADFKAINEAVRSTSQYYTDYRGEVRPLTCEIAYDVGYEFGWERPEWNHQPSWRTYADAHSEQCFRSDALAAYAFVAGIHHAQVDRLTLVKADQ